MLLFKNFFYTMTNLINSNVHYIVNYCGNLKEDELVLIIYDNSTEHLLNSFIEEIEKPTSRYKIRKIPEQKCMALNLLLQ